MSETSKPPVNHSTVYCAFDGRLTYRSRDPFIDGQPVDDITPSSMRGDHPPGVTPLHHKWLPYRSGGPGWRICQWCGLTQRPEEIAHAE